MRLRAGETMRRLRRSKHLLNLQNDSTRQASVRRGPFRVTCVTCGPADGGAARGRGRDAGERRGRGRARAAPRRRAGAGRPAPALGVRPAAAPARRAAAAGYAISLHDSIPIYLISI